MPEKYDPENDLRGYNGSQAKLLLGLFHATENSPASRLSDAKTQLRNAGLPYNTVSAVVGKLIGQQLVQKSLKVTERGVDYMSRHLDKLIQDPEINDPRALYVPSRLGVLDILNEGSLRAKNVKGVSNQILNDAQLNLAQTGFFTSSIYKLIEDELVVEEGRVGERLYSLSEEGNEHLALVKRFFPNRPLGNELLRESYISANDQDAYVARAHRTG